MGRPSKYSEEFQRDAVDLVASSGRPIKHVAVELGISHETLRNWVRARKRRTGIGRTGSGAGGLTPPGLADRDAELVRLRRENAVLRQERDILRKAAAFFAREMDR